MEQIYLTEINIKKVRHLENVRIALSQDEKKHLILTGINGSGKTSVLNAVGNVLFRTMGFMGKEWTEMKLDSSSEEIEIKSSLTNSMKGEELYKLYREGKIIILSIPADRKPQVDKGMSLEKINFNEIKGFREKMNVSFGRFLVNLQIEKLFAKDMGDQETAESTEKWFLWLENALRGLFDQEQLKLVFSPQDMCFRISLPEREPFGLDEMASGYATLFDFFTEIVTRMEKQAHLKYDLPGVVLVDEIEQHLHIAWQKKILPFLVKTFPNLQFIVATHSPFVAASIESAIIYDLEKDYRVVDASAYSYECLVESLFRTTTFSEVIKEKYTRYCELVKKGDMRSPSEDEELIDLIDYLQSKPVFTAEKVIRDFQEKERQRKYGKN